MDRKKASRIAAPNCGDGGTILSKQSTKRSASVSRPNDVEAARLDDPLRLIRKRPLAELLGVNVYTLDNWRRAGRFPQPLILSPQLVAWRRADVLDWIAERKVRPAPTRKPNQAKK